MLSLEIWKVVPLGSSMFLMKLSLRVIAGDFVWPFYNNFPSYLEVSCGSPLFCIFCKYKCYIKKKKDKKENPVKTWEGVRKGKISLIGQSKFQNSSYILI